MSWLKERINEKMETKLWCYNHKSWSKQRVERIEIAILEFRGHKLKNPPENLNGQQPTMAADTQSEIHAIY